MSYIDCIAYILLIYELYLVLIILFLQNCTHAGGQCDTLVDGYFIEVCIGTGLGIIWYIFLNRMLKNLQYKRPSDWQVHKSGPVYKLDNTISSLPDLIVTETSRR